MEDPNDLAPVEPGDPVDPEVDALAESPLDIVPDNVDKADTDDS